MDKKLMLDLIASSFILIFIIGPRFNTWSHDSKAMFTGKPIEYISRSRFVYFSAIYLFTYIILAVVFYNFPELLAFFPVPDPDSELTQSLKQIFGQGSYTFNFLLLTMLLNNSKVNQYEERWKNLLHEWARIPKSVEEIKNTIIQEDSFSPSQKYIDLAIYEIKRETESSSLGETLREYWEKSILNWKEEKQKNSINWCFMKSFFLILIVRDLQGMSVNGDLKLKGDRIRDLGKIIPLINKDDVNDIEQRTELSMLTSLLVECMSKHIVKKYSSKQAQFAAFKNLGFNLTYYDTAETNVSKAIVVSILGVLIINTVVTNFTIEQRLNQSYLKNIPTRELVNNLQIDDMKEGFISQQELDKKQSPQQALKEKLITQIINEIPEAPLIRQLIPNYSEYGINPVKTSEILKAKESLINIKPDKFFDDFSNDFLNSYNVNILIIKNLDNDKIDNLLNRSAMAEEIQKVKDSTLKSWALAGFVSLLIAMFVGLLVQKVNSFRQMEASLIVYAVTLLISTIAALIYFNWGTTMPNSLGKIMLALTYSTVSIVVFHSLEEISHDFRDVLSLTLFHALALGVVMAILQVSIPLSFAYGNCTTGCGEFIWQRLFNPENNTLYTAMLGFAKGFLLGGLITYLVQDSLRRQQLAALRRVPRAAFKNIITLNIDGDERRVDTRNISKKGAMIKCDCNLKPGDSVLISAPFFGQIKGIIRWTQPRFLRKQLTGIEFPEDKQGLRDFIRQQYGEFYA